MIASLGKLYQMSCLARPWPGAQHLTDARGRLGLLAGVESEGLAVGLSRRARTAVRAAWRLFDIEGRGPVYPHRRRPHVGELAAASPAVAVEPDVGRSRGVPDREREVVVCRIRPRADPRELLAHRLRDHPVGIPEADHRADRLAEIQDAAGRSPARHRAEQLRVRETPILRVADLEAVARRAKRLDERGAHADVSQ